MRPILAVSVFSLALAGCSTNQASPDTPISTNSPTIEAETTTSVPELALFQGLLAVDADTGDLLEFGANGWVQLLDGPSYSDETAQSFIESATRFIDEPVVSFCCEPVVGSLATINAGEPVYAGYGTRPAVSNGRLVAFQDLYSEQDGTSLLVYDAFGDQPEKSREILLKGLAVHGMNIHLTASSAYFTWSPEPEGGPWFLSKVDVSASAPIDLLNSPQVALPTAMDVAAAKDLYLFETAMAASTRLYQMPTDLGVSFEDALVSFNLPGNVSSVAVEGVHWVAIVPSGVATSARSLQDALNKPTLSWVGW